MFSSLSEKYKSKNIILIKKQKGHLLKLFLIFLVKQGQGSCPFKNKWFLYS